MGPGEQAIRRQMHATDPDRPEPLLGLRRSKGCIRIPATMNTFLDRRGVLDAACEDGKVQGREFWVLPPDRLPTPWSGRYLVVVDKLSETRPDRALPAKGDLPGH